MATTMLVRSALVALLLVIPWNQADAQLAPRLVRDIFPGPDPTAASYPTSFVAVNGFVLFTTLTDDKLWRTDGTPDGTVAVEGISVETENLLASKRALYPLAGEVLFFGTVDGDVYGLFRTDGSREGTRLILAAAGPSAFVAADQLFFYMYDFEQREYWLWRSDGTMEGTVRLVQLEPPSDFLDQPLHAELNGSIFFGGHNDASGCALWQTDGTVDGTRPVKRLGASTNCIAQKVRSVARQVSFDLVYTGVRSAAILAGSLYFRTHDALWKSDGTEAGTVPVFHWQSDCRGYRITECPPSCLATVDDLLFFAVSKQTSLGQELWLSDGTETGTHVVADLDQEYACDFANAPEADVAFNVRPFSPSYILPPFQRWISDGTPSGTRPSPPPDGRVLLEPHRHAQLGDLVILGRDEVYASDGTETGTVLLRDIQQSPPASSSPTAITGLNGVGIFAARDREPSVRQSRREEVPAAIVEKQRNSPQAAKSSSSLAKPLCSVTTSSDGGLVRKRSKAPEPSGPEK